MPKRPPPAFESAFEEILKRDRLLLSPLVVERIAPATGNDGSQSRDTGYDLDLDLSYAGRTYHFAVEVNARSAPVAVRGAIMKLRMLDSRNRYPMLGIPFLSPDLVQLLESQSISAIDANGNYLIAIPELAAIRLDRPNRFPEPKSIRNIYGGNSSIVGRFLLREPTEHRQVNDIAMGIERRGGGISLATISKVLTGLADDLIVERRPGSIRLVDGPKLLQQLLRAYRQPRSATLIRAKLPTTQSAIADLLNSELGIGNWIWSGSSSAIRYAATTPERIVMAYSRAPLERLERLRAHEDQRFYNCEIRQTHDAYAYFDADGPWASIIQSYLEMMNLDKREREIAEDIGQSILRGPE